MNIFGLEIKRNTKATPEIFGNSNNSAMGFLSMTEQISKLGSKKEQLKAYVDWVYAAAKARSEAVSAIEFIAYANRTGSKSAVVARKVANNKKNYVEKMMKKQVAWVGVVSKEQSFRPALEELDNHPLLDKLYQPNKFMVKEDLIEFTNLHMDLVGESFWYQIKDGKGQLLEIWPLNPTLIQVVPDAKDFIKGYVYTAPSGEKIPMSPDEIIHFKDIDPNNMYRGMGIVQASARAIDTDTNAADWNRNYFYNSAVPMMALSSDRKLSDVAYTRIQEEWNQKFKGTDNAHKWALLEEGLKATLLQTSQKDMEFLEGRKFNRTQILAMFRTSASILGITEDVNRANAEANEYTFSKHVLLPRIKRITNRITEDLAIQYDEKLIISFEDPVPEDKEFRLNEKEKSVGKWKTVNEIREEEGLDPVDGGDMLFTNAGQVPLSMMTLPKEPSDKPKEDPKPEDDAVEEDDDEEEVPVDDPQKQENKTLDLSKKGKKGYAGAPYIPLATKNALYNSLEQRELIGNSFVTVVRNNAIGYEQSFLRVLREFSDAQRTAVEKELKKQMKKDFSATVEKKVPSLIDFREWAKRLAKLFEPLYRTEIREIGVEAGLIVSYTGFDLEDPNVIRFYEERATKVSNSVSDETEKQLRATLKEGVSKGETLDELMSRIGKVYDSFSGYRAEAIARTETIRAAGFAQEESWEQSGVVEGKEWFTAKDERTCEFCGPINGDIRYLGQNFVDKDTTVMGEKGGELSTSYDSIETPPLHVNCRCVLLPIIKE